MSLADESSLLFIPTGYKESKIYSVFPTTGVGDFTFNRNSSATRIAKNGLITSVATDIPRLDYPLIDGVVNGCPSVLLEPQRTNLITYSEDFTNAIWIKTGASVTSGFLSPDGGLNAFKLVEDTSTLGHLIEATVLVDVYDVSQSIYVKPDGIQYLIIRSNSSGGAYLNCTFDLVNGTNTYNGMTEDFKIELVTDGWFKISASNRSSASAFRVFSYIMSHTDVQNNGFPNQTGDGTSGVYIYGAQVEEGSFPTSYIKSNSGSTTTRAAETANGAGDASTFNDSEGVLMAEISALADDLTFRNITISDGSNSNAIYLRYRSTSNVLQALLVVGGVGETYGVNLNDITTFSKAAIKYKENDVAFWVNGFEMVVDTSASTFPNNTLNTLNFQRGNDTLPFYGKTKQIQYYNSALDSEDLEKLTSWTSFTDLANGQQYSIK